LSLECAVSGLGELRFPDRPGWAVRFRASGPGPADRLSTGPPGGGPDAVESDPYRCGARADGAAPARRHGPAGRRPARAPGGRRHAAPPPRPPPPPEPTPRLAPPRRVGSPEPRSIVGPV